ncbi:MAG TPA: hypothetical protein VE010_18175, partial [Thermoanaerobaculia bacterium]|nr:hypothetical protein [Thermoanaerobaculia bacterium]
MLHLRVFVSAVLFISLAAGIICGWLLIEIENSFTAFDRGGVLLHSFDLREWEVLVAWSCVGFLLASAGGV